MKEFDIFKNPYEDEYNDISEAVKLNDGYCPCLLEKSEETKCMCKDFRDSQDTDFCHCGRFYKAKNYETLALIGDVSEEEIGLTYLDWLEKLNHQDFIVLGIPLNLYDANLGSMRHINLCKSIIAKSDAVVVLGHSKTLYPMVSDLMDWAGAIGKKILTREDLVK